MWFNETQKQRYLDNCHYEFTTIETIKVLFNNTSEVEFRNGVDLSNFNENQIIEMYKKFNSKSREFLRSVSSYFFNYYEWCNNENLIDTNLGNPYDLKRVRSIIEEIIPLKLLSNKYFTQEIFMEYMAAIMDISNKFIAYAIYNSITTEELINLKITDLNEESKCVKTYTGRQVFVDDLFIKLMKETNLASHYYPEGVKESNKLGLYSYSQTSYILKPCGRSDDFNDVPITMQIFFARTRIMKKQAGNPFISANVIYKNGLNNFIKKRYKERGISIRDAFMTTNDSNVYMYESEIQGIINDYGASYKTRMIRMQIKDFFDNI